MDRKLFFGVCAAIAVAALLLAYGIEQIWFGGSIVIGVGLVGAFGWFTMRREYSDWATGLFLVGIVLMITFGAFLDLNLFLLMAAMVSGLGAWDLMRFDKGLERYALSENSLDLERRHLFLLGGTLLGGAVLALVVAFVQIQIGFFTALGLGIILILALSGTIRLIQK